MGCTEYFSSGPGDPPWFSHQWLLSAFMFFQKYFSDASDFSSNCSSWERMLVDTGSGEISGEASSWSFILVDCSSAHGAPWVPVCSCSLQTRSYPPSPSLSLCLSPMHHQNWEAPAGSLFLFNPSLPGTLDSFHLYGASLPNHFLSNTSYNSVLFTLDFGHVLVQAIIHVLIQPYSL